SIQDIYRYPIKGLSPQALDRAPLSIGQTIAADRLYAIENGPCGFDPEAPAYFPKHRFLMLMRNERLASLRTHFDETSHTLTIESEGREAARGNLLTKEGRLTIEAFFRRFMSKNCVDRQRFFSERIATVFRMWPEKSFRLSTSPRSRPWKARHGRRSIRCAFVATCMSLAGRHGTNSVLSIRSCLSAGMRGSRSSNASSVVPR